MTRTYWPPRFTAPCTVALFTLSTALLSTFGLAQAATEQGGPASTQSLNASKETSDYDVIVVGSEPEGVTAAVAAAQEGARTLLVSEDARVGGLFVLGQLNSLDLRTQPALYQQGLFLDWWDRVGGGSAFDVLAAEEAFVEMLSEAGVALRLETEAAPVLETRPSEVGDAPSTYVVGIEVAGTTLRADQVIDATADADLAAAAGAPFSFGFSSLGLDERMADTLVFRIDGVDWPALRGGIRARGSSYAVVNNDVAWGHFGGYPAAYEAQELGLRLRGLNLGRQADGSVLVNALLVYDVDPFNEASVAEGYARAEREAPRVINYLKDELPGFGEATFGGVADALYIRESRHLQARCTLTVDDVLGNVVTDEDVVAGGYPLDVQTLTPSDNGYIYGTPEVYGARLCVAVPQSVHNLWVVGKAAGYDPLAASSARVVPFGMALGEAVGVAAARAAQEDLTPAAFTSDREAISALRERLGARGAYLAEVTDRTPTGPISHEFFGAYRTLRNRGLAVGGYANEPNLGAEMSALGYLYLLSNVGQRFFDNDALGQTLLTRFGEAPGALTPQLALEMTAQAACEVGVCNAPSWTQYGLSPDRFTPDDTLTRGEAYALAAWVAQLRDEASGELSSTEY